MCSCQQIITSYMISWGTKPEVPDVDTHLLYTSLFIGSGRPDRGEIANLEK